MRELILSLENIVEVLSKPGIQKKDLVPTQVINNTLWQISEAAEMDEETRLGLLAIGSQIKKQLAFIRKKHYRNNLDDSVILRLQKISKELKAILRSIDIMRLAG